MYYKNHEFISASKTNVDEILKQVQSRTLRLNFPNLLKKQLQVTHYFLDKIRHRFHEFTQILIILIRVN